VPRAWADVSGVLADLEAAHSNLPGRFKACPAHLPNPPARLLLVDHPRPTVLLRDEADSNLDTVGDFDEGDARYSWSLALTHRRPPCAPLRAHDPEYHQFSQNLPELVLIEGIQQVAMKTGRITFSFFIHLSFAFCRRSPLLVLRFYDGVVGTHTRFPILQRQSIGC
jgi:hypothetical protein